jgi:hypothetical protein
MTETATAIIERRRREGEILLAAQRERERQARAEWQAYAESLPRLAYVPTGDPEPGVGYVMCTGRIEAWDGQRVYIAAVPGQWVEEGRARRLGLDGPAVVLRLEREREKK